MLMDAIEKKFKLEEKRAMIEEKKAILEEKKVMLLNLEGQCGGAKMLSLNLDSLDADARMIVQVVRYKMLQRHKVKLEAADKEEEAEAEAAYTPATTP